MKNIYDRLYDKVIDCNRFIFNQSWYNTSIIVRNVSDIASRMSKTEMKLL
jgi:hypothetical protein